MWSELYINDPDILSDVTEIAVKKLGYWIERRLREGRSSPPPRTFYLYRVLLNMWDTFRESTFHGSQLLLSPLLTIPRGRANLDPTDEKQESIRIRSIRKKKGKISRDLRRKRHHRRRFPDVSVSYFMDDSSRSSYHRYSHVYYSLASRDNTSCRSPRVGQINFIRGSPRFANPCRPKRFEFIRVSR